MHARISNINLLVRDVQAAKTFYTTVLGLAEPDERGGPPTMALLLAGGCTISLQDAEAMGQAPAACEGIELGFEVEDVDAAWRAMRAAGVEVLGAPVDQSFGRTFDARDPDGHRLVIFHMKGE
ncbi:hypothetical protein SE17_42770 [Kouleothrix aurantiaca]|jgi:predicted enzyme related to lactoylglutathione lyase|uniref:VOC domain-containing protein n=1 Tax=Kouleothrix aurantiaca TaxID=186479 RepID=A0A0P9CVU2_9CHLR|nr:hypothetical protein SE17_42770 [Kouleothrix aurantiaca]